MKKLKTQIVITKRFYLEENPYFIGINSVNHEYTDKIRIFMNHDSINMSGLL
jgi:hypothetical protein